MSFNYDNIVKDSDPIVREKSVTVPIPMHEEDKELLMDMFVTHKTVNWQKSRTYAQPSA